MEALFAFGAALLSLRLASSVAGRWRATRRPELAAWSAALLAYAAASAALAWGAAAGWDARAFRVYYLFGGLLTAPLLGVGSLLLYGWKRIIAAGAHLRRACGRDCDLRSAARSLRREHPGRPGPPRVLPGAVRGDRREHGRHTGRRRCGDRHDQTSPTRERAHPGGGRRCRPWHRSIRLGCCENGRFCGNCSTSSLRRFYSLSASAR